MPHAADHRSGYGQHRRFQGDGAQDSRGEGLPSVQAGGKYQIIGFNQAVNDFSTVVFPADVRNCTFCHDQNNGAAQTKAFLNPSRAACGSCHDNVNFATGENHSADNLPEVCDNQCTNCHTPQGELEFDASIMGAHTIPRLSSSLPGTVFNLVKVENAAPGKSPTLTFGVKDKAGNAIPVPSLDRLALVLAGPTTDYAAYVSEDPRKTAVANGDGTYKYTFKAAIPAGATGTYSIGIEGYRNEKLLPGTKKEVTVRDAGANQVISFSVDGSTVAPRRTVVAIDNCNQCHSSLSVHGDNRNQTVMCVLCHNPNTTDADQRTAANQPAADGGLPHHDPQDPSRREPGSERSVHRHRFWRNRKTTSMESGSRATCGIARSAT